MSRIETKITILEGVTVTLENTLTVKGPKRN